MAKHLAVSQADLVYNPTHVYHDLLLGKHKLDIQLLHLQKSFHGVYLQVAGSNLKQLQPHSLTRCC